MAVRERSTARRRFVAFLRQRRLRLTAQRRAIVETVFGTAEHFTAEQLLAWSRRRDRSVSKATVYRTLPLLAESGLVRETDFGKGRKCYDPNYADHPNHSHIICQDCHRIFEFDDGKLGRLEAEISAALGFELQSQHLQLIGKCETLRRLGVCSGRDETAGTGSPSASRG
jgi:Fur family transcriptional regulator, ferric uptake regulator